MGTFIPAKRKKGTDLEESSIEVCPLLLGNDECPHFPETVNVPINYRVSESSWSLVRNVRTAASDSSAGISRCSTNTRAMSRIERSPLISASMNACTRLEIACISKAGVRGRAEATSWAITHGLVDVERSGPA